MAVGGDDTLRGGDENDKLNGGDGNDHLDARFGDDIATGGKGNDTYEVSDSKDKVVELANQGYDTVRSRATTYTLAANVEALVMFRRRPQRDRQRAEQ